ncbi:MAG: hypothetical protein RLZZ445_486 [Pseudomonadota bacterium]|jgi:uncharacterized protein (TIGR00251 family)
MNEGWLRFHAESARLTLQIHAQPNAKSTGAAGLHSDALKVRIAAPALDDKANTALLVWLSDALDLPRSMLKIRSGSTSRRKVVEIQPADAALAARAAALPEE